MKILFVLMLSVSFHAIAQTERSPVTASRGSEIDVAIICEYYAEFKQYNKVLCAAAAQIATTSSPMYMPKELACLYSTVRSDLRVCPIEEVMAMELPEVPFLEGDLPKWPADLKPVVTVVNGKALNEALPMHEALFNNQFEVAAFCISEDGVLKKDDRILCGPFVESLSLADKGKYSGDPRNIIIERLKKKIYALEVEMGLKPAPLKEIQAQ